MSSLAPIIESFFTTRLIEQRRASPQTISSYRTTFCLLLRYANHQLGKPPNQLDLHDLDAPLITSFLAHLEQHRHNSARTRNARLAAVRSLFRYAALREPDSSAVIQRVLAIPDKRTVRPTLTYLTADEVVALLVLAVQTGLRLSELTGLTVDDISFDHGPHVRCVGKGRKERATPLTRQTTAVLRASLAERGTTTGPFFPTRQGHRLSSDAVQALVARYVKTAAQNNPALAAKPVSPHTLRHTAAMRLVEAGVDATVIALWLGHESIETTSIYVHADMGIKQKAIDRTTPIATKPGRYRPPDPLLAFPESL
jgi:integrase